jgi:hypothetical protein
MQVYISVWLRSDIVIGIAHDDKQFDKRLSSAFLARKNYLAFLRLLLINRLTKAWAGFQVCICFHRHIPTRMWRGPFFIAGIDHPFGHTVKACHGEVHVDER